VAVHRTCHWRRYTQFLPLINTIVVLELHCHLRDPADLTTATLTLCVHDVMVQASYCMTFTGKFHQRCYFWWRQVLSMNDYNTCYMNLIKGLASCGIIIDNH